MKQTQLSITDKIISELASITGLEKNTINTQVPITNYGVDSLQSVSLSGLLESWLDVDLDPTVLWDNPTIEKLSHYLYSLYTNKLGVS